MAYIIIKIGGEECIVSIFNKFIIGWVSDMLALKILRLATVGLWTYLHHPCTAAITGGVELPRWFWNLGTLLGFQASWKNFSSASPWLWGRSQWCWILRDGTRYQIHKQLVVFVVVGNLQPKMMIFKNSVYITPIFIMDNWCVPEHLKTH